MRAFISHTSSDQRIANQLKRALTSMTDIDVQVWSDDVLVGGENWANDLRDMLQKSDCVFVIVSPEALTSKYIMNELSMAWAYRQPIIMVAQAPSLVNRLPVDVSRSQIMTLEDLDNPARLGRKLMKTVNESA